MKTDDDAYVNLKLAVAAAIGTSKRHPSLPMALGLRRTSTTVARVGPNDARLYTKRNECPTYMYNGALYPDMLHGAGKTD